MKKNHGNIEDFAKLKNLKKGRISKLRNFKNEDFQLWWWRDPPYKNDDFRHRVQLLKGSENQILR